MCRQNEAEDQLVEYCPVVERRRMICSKFLLLFGRVAAVVVSFDIFEDRLHLLGLALPFFVTHLGLAAEELVIGLAVATPKTVPEGCELAVVVVEVQVVHGVASSTVHNGAIGDIFPIVDEHRPEVNEAEEKDVGDFLQGENKRENMVGHTLGPAIERVESVRGVGTRHNPLVVRLV